jgi:hypothetical protein
MHYEPAIGAYQLSRFVVDYLLAVAAVWAYDNIGSRSQHNAFFILSMHYKGKMGIK